MSKFNFIFDNTNKAKKLKKMILKNYKNYSPKNAEVIVVSGGDGFMLKTMKKFNCRNIVFSSSATVYKSKAKSELNENDVCLPVNPYGDTKLTIEKSSFSINMISFQDSNYFKTLNTKMGWGKRGDL